jgi:translation elongation factor EF-1beta
VVNDGRSADVKAWTLQTNVKRRSEEDLTGDGKIYRWAEIAFGVASIAFRIIRRESGSLANQKKQTPRFHCFSQLGALW